jgi:hypothetical protein
MQRYTLEDDITLKITYFLDLGTLFSLSKVRVLVAAS